MKNLFMVAMLVIMAAALTPAANAAEKQVRAKTAAVAFDPMTSFDVPYTYNRTIRAPVRAFDPMTSFDVPYSYSPVPARASISRSLITAGANSGYSVY